MGLAFGPKNTLGLIRTSAERAADAFAKLFMSPRCAVVVSAATIAALKTATFKQRSSETSRRELHLLATPSDWCVVWATTDDGLWDPDLVSSLAKASGFNAVHALFADDDPRGARLEFVFYDGGDRFARKVSVMGGRKVSTLALGPPLAGEPERALLERHVQHREAAAGLREFLVRTGLPDAWDKNLYEDAAQVVTVACSYTPAPIITQSSPRSTGERNEIPPEYLSPYARSPANSAAADLLLDGESLTSELFGVWDIELFGSKVLLVEVPRGDFNAEVWPDDADGWPVVRVASPLRASDRAIVYDSRAVVASQHEQRGLPQIIAPTIALQCDRCSARTFRVSVGFESSKDRLCPDDTSWFGLAVECSKCRRAAIVWEHEPFT
jgi:hypothetical protein